MKSEDMVMLGFLGVVFIFLIGMGSLVYVGISNDQEVRLSCIQSGKSWIENSCVKVSP